MNKPRILYILPEYPQISETYMQVEIDALRDEYEIKVISLTEPDLSYKHHHPYQFIADPAQIREAVEEFRPAVMHSHWLYKHVPLIGDLARQTNVPFTVRAHSFDSIMWKRKPPSVFGRIFGNHSVPRHIANAVSVVNDDLCLGVLAFPFVRAHLERAGMRAEKIRDCYPVVNYERFHDSSPNGQAVMNGGACLPKKQMQDFLELALALPGMQFNLYAMGYQVQGLHHANDKLGSPVHIKPAVEPDDMPREYKKHRWLVYTASPEMITTGWPVMIAEAQASGVGICMRNIRPDLKEYVGQCGFLYDSIAEVRNIITQPFPEELRQIGFEHAKKSDIRRHKHLLTDLWRKALN
jgi:hypothetical protein